MITNVNKPQVRGRLPVRRARQGSLVPGRWILGALPVDVTLTSFFGGWRNIDRIGGGGVSSMLCDTAVSRIMSRGQKGTRRADPVPCRELPRG
jgi:hypothetical protein